MPHIAIAPLPDPAPVAARPGWPELFGALPVAVLLVDPSDHVAQANAPAEQLLNLSEHRMLGRPITELLRSPKERAAADGQDLAVYDAEVAVRGGTLRVDFTEAHIAGYPGWRAVTLHSPGPRQFFPLSDGTRALTGAAAILAHEIKNPLSGIRGAAQLLGPSELTSLIVTEVDRVAALIDRMQGLTDTRPIPIGPENIYPVLAHARQVALLGFAQEVVIDEQYDPSLPTAEINPDALTQVMLNLLRNAAEALVNTSQPCIAIATAYRHGSVKRIGRDGQRVALPIEISVVDNGPGPPSDIAGQLFSPFVSGRRDGVGLGLALVDKLVRDMGGLVQYAREQDRTVFRVLLPRGAGA